MANFIVNQTTDDGSGSTAGTLSYAILQANQLAGDDTITIDSDVRITGVVKTLINSNITIVGNNHSISGDVNNNGINDNGDVRPLFILSGTVGISNLTITNGRAKGGDSFTGGGGAGLGGGLFIYDGNVSLNNVAFTNNAAQGGSSGVGGLGNGGGGMFGDAGGNAGGGLFAGSTGGYRSPGGYGGNGNYGGYGGYFGAGFYDPGKPNGGFGGGGVINGGFGGGAGFISGNPGFAGGFGGGGGFSNRASFSFDPVSGGNGGYGAGGGGWSGSGSFGSGGSGGFAAGNGNSSGQGGGGAGLGGGIFVRSGSLTLSNTTFTNNTATGGTGANSGQGLGGAIFIMQSTTNTNGNNQGMPTVLPTVTSLGNPTFSGNSAANDAGTATNNDDVYGTINITSPPAPTVSITAQTATATEGGSNGVYRISRSDTTGDLTVNLTIDGSSTAATADYTLSGGSVSISGNTLPVTITDGNSFVDINLAAFDDSTTEVNETLTLNLDTGTGYTIDSTNNTATVTITDNDTVVTNTNDSGEGSLRQAILNANANPGADTITFAGSVFTDATPDTITLTSGELVITDDVTIQGTGANQLTVSGNNASRVFNISNSGTDATIDALTIANGNSINGGGILINSNASLVLTNSTISNNNSGGNFGGAGIGNRGGTLNVINSTISGNTSSSFGGGIASQGTLTVTNSTISGNTAASRNGGGLIVGGVITLISSTITNNTAGNAGGGVAAFFGTTTAQNTIIAGNFDTSNQAPDISGNITGDANNLIGSLTGTSGTIGTGSDITFASAGITNINQVLAALANNGGTTQTHALVAGSAAINAGNNALVPSGVTTDQRGTGFNRISRNTVDIGAYEVQNNNPIATNDSVTTNEDTAVNGNVLTNDTDLDTSDILTVSAVNGNPANVGNQITLISGALLTLNSNGTFAYNPNGQFESLGVGATANDSFTYTISDGSGGTSTATVNLTINGVNDAPTGSPTATLSNTPEDTAITITAAQLLTGFSDVDAGDTLSVTNLTATNGALVNNNNGTYTFTPNANFNGTVNLNYNVTDGTATLTGQTQTFSVTPVNDAPVAVDDSVSTFFGTTVNIPVSTLLANDSDVDSPSLSITGVSGATHGTAVLNNNGTANNSADDFVSFTPNLWFSGNASFNYTLSDGSLTDTGTVTVAVGANIFGTNFADYLTGTVGNDIINGGNGNDTIYGGAGSDSLNGDNGNDILYGDGLMDGGAGNDTLNGGNGDDTLYGGGGSDYLIGGNGNDLLYGGTGSDILTGNNGNDIFAFTAGEGTDTITDFTKGQDKIGLYGGLSFGQLSFSGNNILVTSTNEVLATLSGINTTTLTAANFVNL
ncbi:cadherin-like domain-containing protein [Nostoc sp. CENA67]|uniref:Cadherin-like domain-containing protein n=1 Tax=Amazonocrinis nigriterrae CENA67 TaxID=2794033 RepID=A0A8J7HYI8_9NOST|nr:cadherin-like domain-containing protein [Amazonocrinis nigriterrae]MBH8564824.1 cadherin-like domain-containing protein [Amazonocrinis nigriterrae CENA67]